MSKLPLVVLISGVALSLASPIVVRAATQGVPKDAEDIIQQGEPQPKKERVQKPVTTPKNVSTPKDAEAIIQQGEPQPKKERVQKPVTTPKNVSAPKDAEAIIQRGEPQSKPKY